jgi:hypothetical protein
MSTTSQSDERTTRDLVNLAEQHAALLRRQAGVGPRERLDPRALVDALKLVIVEPGDVAQATAEDCTLVTEVDAKAWSGMGKPRFVRGGGTHTAHNCDGCKGRKTGHMTPVSSHGACHRRSESAHASVTDPTNLCTPSSGGVWERRRGSSALCVKLTRLMLT